MSVKPRLYGVRRMDLHFWGDLCEQSKKGTAFECAPVYLAEDCDSALARVAALTADRDRLREALGELLSAEMMPMPPYEAGKEAQDAWADRRAAARNEARAALAKEPTP